MPVEVRTSFARIFISPLTDDVVRLFDPYNRPVLHVRRPGSDDVEEYKFLNDDPFLTEISEFVDVIEHGKPVENLLSTFEGTCDRIVLLLRVIITPMFHLPAPRRMQDVRTYVGNTQGWRRDACKTREEVGCEDWTVPSCSFIRVVLESS